MSAPRSEVLRAKSLQVLSVLYRNRGTLASSSIAWRAGITVGSVKVHASYIRSVLGPEALPRRPRHWSPGYKLTDDGRIKAAQMLTSAL